MPSIMQMLMPVVLFFSFTNAYAGPFTTICASGNNNFQECSCTSLFGRLPAEFCASGKKITDVVLVEKLSSVFTSCDEGEDWGYDEFSLWTDNGCRASFKVYPEQTGRWVPSNARRCEEVCREKEWRPATDWYGAACASGEARPTGAIGYVEFIYGCWPNCDPQGNIPTYTASNYCYMPGQKVDEDPTDQIVGCFCEMD